MHIQNKLISQIKRTRVYMERDFSSDCYLFASKLSLWTRWRKLKHKGDHRRKQIVYKLNLLHYLSIQRLHHERLVNVDNMSTYYLQYNVERNYIAKEWNSILEVVKRASDEEVGKNRRYIRKEKLSI